MKNSRRTFIKQTSLATGAGIFWLYGCGSEGQPKASDKTETEAGNQSKELFFKISLAQWSLHKTFFDKKLDNLDFATTARNTYGIEGIEYVNQFFKDKATDADYLAEMNKRAADNGVQQLLIMIDGEGGLAETDSKKLNEAVENHKKWVDAAKTLGCHSIRVNAFSSNPDPIEAAKAAIEGLGKLGEYGQQAGINVIVENHGGFSSNGSWLATIMQEMRERNQPNVGTLPDFGNFCIKRDNKGGDPWTGECIQQYDRYQGVAEMMPYAKGVSAKSHDFDENGNEINTDYAKMLKIVKDAGYTGFIGIEYEGEKLSEDEGIRKTLDLLKRVGMQIG